MLSKKTPHKKKIKSYKIYQQKEGITSNNPRDHNKVNFNWFNDGGVSNRHKASFKLTNSLILLDEDELPLTPLSKFSSKKYFPVLEYNNIMDDHFDKQIRDHFFQRRDENDMNIDDSRAD